ncbi:hypothetical protein ACROYT_G006966 [Oculina patagonica]
MSKSEINFIPGYVNIEVEEGTLGEEDGALQMELDLDTYKPYHDKPISCEEWVSEYKMKQETQLEFEQKHAESAHQQTAAPNVPQAMNEEQLISKEEEARLENQRVVEFINTLDEELAKKLAIRALQKGVGSMDFVDSLLIMEPEDDDSTDQEHDVAGDGSPV